MIIGITGSSGAGKSTACEILSEKYDIEIIDADKIARKLTDTNKDYLNEIVSKFGDDILLPDGTLNRKKLANIIYTDRDKRHLLNSCTFKYIKKEVKDRIKEGKNFAIDAPLLMECLLLYHYVRLHMLFSGYILTEKQMKNQLKTLKYRVWWKK